MLDTVAELLGIAKAKMVAGFLGALLALAWIKGPFVYRGALFVGGWAASIYVTPILNHAFELETAGMEFLVGIFSMSTVAAVFRTMEQVDFAGITQALKDFFRGGK